VGLFARQKEKVSGHELEAMMDGLDRQLSIAFYALNFALFRSYLTRGDITVMYWCTPLSFGGVCTGLISRSSALVTKPHSCRLYFDPSGRIDRTNWSALQL
jgi:hypothetical protein